MPITTSERLKRSKTKIIQRWLELAHQEIRATLHQSSLALSNSLEGFLDKISEALSVEFQKTEEQAKFDREQFTSFARDHGESRAGMKNYTIEGLIREYHIFRQTICDVLEEDEPLDAREREIITSIIEQAVNDAASHYSRILREIREKFTATIVHDLRNPIAAAMMSAQIILRNPADSGRCLSNAGRILDRLNHVSSMIDDVLDASLLSAGEKLSLPFEECNLGNLLKSVIVEYSEENPNRLRLAMAGEITGYWNPRAIRRIVDNLITNALKYGAPNEPITISAETLDSKVTISVHNRGPIISPEDQSLLFQQFRRAKGVGSQSGWGLGLVVVKGLAEAHRGSVLVESSLVDGTTFIVTLPKDSRTADRESPMRDVG